MTINILLYKKMYNDNKYFYYTRRCIMTINILLYKTMYNKNILLYKKTYNKIFVSIIQEDV